MTNKTHRAESSPRPVHARVPATGTERAAHRRPSSGFRPPAQPTVVHLPQQSTPSRKLMVLGMLAVLGVWALASAWWLSPQDSPRSTVVVESRPPMPAEHPVQDEWESMARQIPAPDEPPPLSMASFPTPFEKSVLHLARGDTLTDLLAGLDLDKDDVARAIAALTPYLDARRLQAGQPIRVTLERPAGPDESPILRDLTIRPEPRRRVVLERDDEGTYRAKEKIFAVLKKVRRVVGRIEDSLIVSAKRAGLPQGALGDMLHAFAWDVSFQHDLKAGDRFDALVERAYTEDGKPVGAGHLLWAELTTGSERQSFSVYRFKPKAGRDFFYTPKGESVVRALLRTPLDLAHVTISSAFGRRHHPVLGFTRMHEGVDFPAPPGTPVLAAGDGRVAQAGRNGGYGNWVKIVHPGVLATGYAHLQRIARGIRPGVTVRQSQVIGFVGSTGLSTGPHVHFELRRNGTAINPLSVAHRSLRTRLAGPELARFMKVVGEIDRLRSDL